MAGQPDGGPAPAADGAAGAQGVPTNEVARRCNSTNDTVRAWRHRFEAEGVSGRTVRITLTFEVSRRDLSAISARFPYAVQMNRPFRYRVREILEDGTRVDGDWSSRESWADLIDINNMNTDPNRSTTMNLMNENLARAQMSARLGEAHELRRGHQLALARRMSRKAEQAAQQARLALARAL